MKNFLNSIFNPVNRDSALFIFVMGIMVIFILLAFKVSDKNTDKEAIKASYANYPKHTVYVKYTPYDDGWIVLNNVVKIGIPTKNRDITTIYFDDGECINIINGIIKWNGVIFEEWR